MGERVIMGSITTPSIIAKEVIAQKAIEMKAFEISRSPSDGSAWTTGFAPSGNCSACEPGGTGFAGQDHFATVGNDVWDLGSACAK